MTLKTIPVVLDLTLPDGTPAAHASVVFELVASDTYAPTFDTDTATGLVVPSQVAGMTDAAGHLELPCWPNGRGSYSTQYTVTALQDQTLVLSCIVTVPDLEPAAPVALEAIINQPPYPAVDAAQAALTAMQTLVAQYGVDVLAVNAVAGLAAQVASDAEEVAVNTISTTEAATAADASADEALGYRNTALGAQAAAVAAADAAQLSGGVYASTAAGLAAVASGRYFSVPSATSSEYLILYLNNAGTAVEQKRYPATSAVTTLAATVAALSDTAVKGREDLDASAYAYVILDSAGKVAFAIDWNGNTLDSLAAAAAQTTANAAVAANAALAATALTGAESFEAAPYAFSVLDAAGNVGLAITWEGQLVGDLLEGAGPPEPALLAAIEATGARGTITGASESDATFYNYTSDVLGGALPYLRKKSGTLRAHLLDTADVIDAHISYGQSWRSLSYDGARKLFGGHQAERHITLYKEGGSSDGPIGVGAGVSIGGALTDLANVTDDELFSIGRACVEAYHRLSDSYGRKKTPMLEFCHAYPGSSWTTGAGGGLAPGGTSWTNGLALIAAATAQTAAYGKQIKYRSVGWTQGGSADYASSLTDLAAMMAAYDALNLPGTADDPLQFYIGLPGGNASTTEMTDGQKAWLQMCLDNTNGRTWLTTPWYPWKYRTDAGDDIHTGPYGAARHGEMEAYAKFCVEVLGLPWNPCWVHRTTPIAVAGNKITITFEVPPGPEFQDAELMWDTTTIEAAESYGFRVYIGGTKQTISSVAITGLTKRTVELTMAASISAGTSVEVSYAARNGVAQPNNTHSGLWGNLLARGAVSRMNPSWFLDAWACNFIKTITA